METAFSQIDESIDISELYRLLLAGHGGTIITKNKQATGLLIKMNLVNFWAKKVEWKNMLL